MGKARHNISNWRQYNRALINRGSLIFWVDEQAINSGIAISIMAAEGAVSNTSIVPLKRR